MYDPRIGRFLEEDPTGFEAGDSDLYRYASNEPTDKTDPSGLQDQPQQAGPIVVGGAHQNQRIEDPLGRSDLPSLYRRPFPARVFFDSPATTNREGELRKELLAAIQDAAHRVDRALYVLEYYWPEVQARFRDNVEVNHAFAENQRQYYLTQLRNVYRQLTDPRSVLHFDIHGDPSGDHRGDVNFFWRYRTGSNINIYPLFFQQQDGTLRTDRQRARTVVHEFGRFFPEISDDVALQRWDNLVMTLSDRADDVTRMRHPDGLPLPFPPSNPPAR